MDGVGRFRDVLCTTLASSRPSPDGVLLVVRPLFSSSSSSSLPPLYDYYYNYYYSLLTIDSTPSLSSVFFFFFSFLFYFFSPSLFLFFFSSLDLPSLFPETRFDSGGASHPRHILSRFFAATYLRQCWYALLLRQTSIIDAQE